MFSLFKKKGKTRSYSFCITNHVKGVPVKTVTSVDAHDLDEAETKVKRKGKQLKGRLGTIRFVR